MAFISYVGKKAWAKAQQLLRKLRKTIVHGTKKSYGNLWKWFKEPEQKLCLVQRA